MQSVMLTQSPHTTRSAFVPNGGPAQTAVPIADHVHQHATAAPDLALTNVRIVLPTPTTTLMDLVSVAMSGWAQTAHTNMLTAMKHVKSASTLTSTSVSYAKTGSPSSTDTAFHVLIAVLLVSLQTVRLLTSARPAPKALDLMTVTCADHAILHAKRALARP